MSKSRCSTKNRILLPFLGLFLLSAMIACDSLTLPATDSSSPANPESATSELGTDDASATASVATAWAAATKAATQLTSTPAPTGFSRANPFPVGELIRLPPFDVQVLDLVRGENAWQRIQQANQFNDPPLENQEYILVQYWIKNTSNDADVRDLNLAVTGSRGVLYPHYRAGVVVPEPRLQTELAGGEEHLGWLAYQIYAGETNLLVMAEEWFALDEPPRYGALVEGAVVTIPEALDNIAPNDLGRAPAEPVIYGQVATGDDWQVRVVDTAVSGDAWQILQEANQFNDPPTEGRQYVLVRVWVRYIGFAEGPHFVSDSLFALENSAGDRYDAPAVVAPKPELHAELFPGGDAEGWIALTAPVESDPLLVFEAPRRAEIRYFSLNNTGR